MLEKNYLVQCAKYLAVGDGTLTSDMNDRLVKQNDVALAVQIFEKRKDDLRAGCGQFLTPPTQEAIDTMIQSLDEAIACLNQP